MKNQVISLYDYTGEALRPWAEAGYECFAYDIQHKMYNRREVVGSGSITYSHADLYKKQTLMDILVRHGANNVAFLSAFPPCTDLASAGAPSWSKKAEVNPHFQTDAAGRLKDCAILAEAFRCPFYIENPNGAVPRLWRKPDFRFDPYQYGGYLPEEDEHPIFPEVIPPRDAYKKRTCLWTGCGFRMPEPRPVEYENVKCIPKNPLKGENYSPVHAKTGGKSLRTKNIRSATPRGFAKAVYEENQCQIT
jgi:hypothetical protein